MDPGFEDLRVFNVSCSPRPRFLDHCSHNVELSALILEHQHLDFIVVHDTLPTMPSLKALLLALANALIPIAILVFATGFFPYKPFMQGLATHEEPGWEDTFEWNKDGQPAPMFDKLVFMVVDALRSDFVYAEGGGMKFVQRYVTLLEIEERGGDGSGSSVC